MIRFGEGASLLSLGQPTPQPLSFDQREFIHLLTPPQDPAQGLNAVTFQWSMNKVDNPTYLTFRTLVFYGLLVVAGLALLRLLSSGLWVFGRSTWLLPLEREFSLDRASISHVFTIGTLFIGITGLFAGWLADRWGPRRFMAVWLMVASCGFFLLPLVNGIWTLAFITVLPLSLALNWGAVQGPTAITNNWFERKKAYALSWLNVGNGMGGFIVAGLAFVIVFAGWRWAAIASGSIMPVSYTHLTLPTSDLV